MKRISICVMLMLACCVYAEGLFPGKVFITSGGMSAYTYSVDGSVSIDDGKVVMGEDDILAYTSVVRYAGKAAYYETVLFPRRLAGFMSFKNDSLPPRRYLATYAEDVEPVTVTLTHVPEADIMEYIGDGVYRMVIAFVFDWGHDTVMLWDEGGDMRYSGIVN